MLNGHSSSQGPARALLLTAVLVGGALLPAQSLGEFDNQGSLATLAAPVVFVESRGQWCGPGLYRARQGAAAMALGPQGWMLAAQVVEPLPAALPDPDEAGLGPRAWRMRPSRAAGVAVSMHFEGSRPSVLPQGEARIPGHFNFFVGDDPNRWRTLVPAFERIRYAGLYPGVDVVVRSQGGTLEYDLLLAPGASLSAVVIRCEGHEELEVAADGSLLLHTVLGTFRQTAPVAWQELPDGGRQPLASQVVLLDAGRFTFEVPERHPDLPLVIDPGLLWSTFLGGSAAEFTNEVRLEGSGQVTVTSDTFSWDFPATAGSYTPTLRDGAVTRLDPAATGVAQLVWSTIFGGTQDDWAWGLGPGPAGGVTVTGWTYSLNLPSTANAFQPNLAGGQDAFVACFDLLGVLSYLTYYGGWGNDRMQQGPQVDANGVTTFAGHTNSPNLPVTPGTFQPTLGGGFDGFVAQLDLSFPIKPPANQLRWGTFLGGSAFDLVRPVAVDAAGVVSVGGLTYSANFPVTSGAFPFGGGAAALDGFITRLDPNLVGSNQLRWSTFLGGSGPTCPGAGNPSGDGVNGLALTMGDQVVVAGGWTDSCSDFPVTPGAFDTTYNGGGTTNSGGDVFLAWLDVTLPPNQAVLYATFLGGSGTQGESCWGLAVDEAAVATVAGWTDSSGPPGIAVPFPVTPGALLTALGNGGVMMGFVSRLNPRAGACFNLPPGSCPYPPSDALAYSTFLGASDGQSNCYKPFLDEANGALVAGQTYAPSFLTTGGAFQPTYGGGTWDGFVTHLDMLPVGVTRTGASTAACLGPLAMGVNRMPVSGDPTFAFTCTRAPPNAGGLLAIGIGAGSGAVAGGIAIYVDLGLPWFALPAISDQLGYAEVVVPIPAGLTGVQFSCQFAWQNTATCGGSAWSASNALNVIVN